MDNWINLDNLPRRKDGKISWKDCDHNLVEFCYKDNIDSFLVIRRINVDNVLVNFNNKQIELSIQSIQKVSLGKLYGFAVNNNYKFHVGEIIEDNTRKLEVINCIRIDYSNGKDSKGYIVKCLKCGNIYKISEANLIRGDNCSICSGHILRPGVNDLWSTRPDICEMLANKEDGYKYMEYSNVLLDFVCPKCGEYLGKSYLHNVSRFGLSCKYCGSGISYPNRLMSNLLNHIDIPFETEVKFKWCYFPSFKDANSFSTGRYDFVIEESKLIIEMDGGFGHGNNPHPKSKYSKEELIYRDQCKDNLAQEHGYDLIRIDCDYSCHNRLDYCSKNILNSRLSSYFNLDNVNWQYINTMCA